MHQTTHVNAKHGQLLTLQSYRNFAQDAVYYQQIYGISSTSHALTLLRNPMKRKRNGSKSSKPVNILPLPKRVASLPPKWATKENETHSVNASLPAVISDTGFN
jgi:hypothetical protein